MGARLKYHTDEIRIGGTASSQGRASGGTVITSAAATRTAVTSEMVISGIASRTARLSRSISVVVRDTRSPVPARSTTPVGKETALVRKSSRRSASTSSPSTPALSLVERVKTVCTTSAATKMSAALLMTSAVVPLDRLSTRPPRMIGPARPAIEATPLRAITTENSRRCRRSSVRT